MPNSPVCVAVNSSNVPKSSQIPPRRPNCRVFVKKQQIQTAVQRWSVGWDASWSDWGGALLQLHQANTTHAHTDTHSELYNRTKLSPVYREFRHLFDKIHSTCLSHPTYTHLCHSLKHPHSSENKQSKEVFLSTSFLPTFPIHTHRVRLHTHRKALALSRKLAPIKRKKENHYVLYIEQTVVVLSTHILLHGCILVWYCCSVQDKLQYNEEPS